MVNKIYGWMYKTKVWKEGRLVHLAQHPLCASCASRGIVRAATVVNHRVAHRGQWTLFKDSDNWQSLCKSCHDSEAQSQDVRGYTNRIGNDGWPLDDRHPLYKMALDND